MRRKKIGIFFGGRISKHLRLMREAGEKLGLDVELVSYNRVFFDSDEGVVRLRSSRDKARPVRTEDMDKFDVYFFRTTGKHWEEVGLILDSIRDRQDKIVVDPLVWQGRPTMALKAYQMLTLKRAGIDVPRSIYSSLQCLKQVSKNYFKFPFIIKGSGGDRGTRVYIVYNQKELDGLVMELRPSEIHEGRRYMAQEYIENDGDYRVFVLEDKVLGIMKRSSQSKDEFKNNYSAGGKVEVSDLSDEIKQLAIDAAKKCGLLVAGVDVAFRDFDKNKPVIWEVNKGPQFTGFMKATGIDVPSEIVNFLDKLSVKRYGELAGDWK